MRQETITPCACCGEEECCRDILPSGDPECVYCGYPVSFEEPTFELIFDEFFLPGPETGPVPGSVLVKACNGEECDGYVHLPSFVANHIYNFSEHCIRVLLWTDVAGLPEGCHVEKRIDCGPPGTNVNGVHQPWFFVCVKPFSVVSTLLSHVVRGPNSCDAEVLMSNWTYEVQCADDLTPFCTGLPDWTGCPSCE